MSPDGSDVRHGHLHVTAKTKARRWRLDGNVLVPTTNTILTTTTLRDPIIYFKTGITTTGTKTDTTYGYYDFEENFRVH